MIKILLLIVIMSIQFSCSSGSKSKNEIEKENDEVSDKSEKQSIVDPEVLSRLERMGNYMRELKKFEVNSNSTFEIVLDNDQKTKFEAKIKYKVERPDKLFAEIKSERKHRQYFYNGKIVTIFSPKEKYYGEIPFTGSLAELVKKLSEFGVEVPLSDLFAWGTEDTKAKKTTSAIFLNEDKKRYEVLDHFAIRQDKIDWQVWLREGKNPLPEKVLYEINDDTARPRMSASLKWNTKPHFSADTFIFEPPKGSHKIKILPARKPEEK